MDIKLNTIECIDCFEYLKKIPDKYVNLVFVDPPYKIKWKQQIELHGRKAFYHNFEELKKWDDIDIKDLYERLFPEFDRIVKDEGSVLIFVRNEYVTYCVDAAKKHNFDVKATIFWHKTNPPPQVRLKNYLSSVESIVWLARYKKEFCPFTFNFKKQTEMHNFIEMPICQGNERLLHPTQKPLNLIKHFLEIHSNPGDIILDCFMGTATTAVASLILGRKFLGCDNNPKYFEMSMKRLIPFLEQKKLISYG